MNIDTNAFTLKPFNENIRTLDDIKEEFDFDCDLLIDTLKEIPDIQPAVDTFYKRLVLQYCDMESTKESKFAKIRGGIADIAIHEGGMTKAEACSRFHVDKSWYYDMRKKYYAEWEKDRAILKEIVTPRAVAMAIYYTIWHRLHVEKQINEIDLDKRMKPTLFRKMYSKGMSPVSTRDTILYYWCNVPQSDRKKMTKQRAAHGK
ncbi:MAG: hypothetical protein ACYDEF_03720 [Methanosarcina sp.]